MDLFPLYNSIRIAGISTIIVTVIGIIISYFVCKLPKMIKGILDVIFTIPLVLPPTVIGFLILVLIAPNRPLGKLIYDLFGVRLTMNWYSAIFSTVIVIFPLMYRTCRSGFENFDYDIANAGKTLGLSDVFVFFKITIPNCVNSIMAGAILAFARALGEYGATSMVCGYTPSKTATISTTVYQFWRINNDRDCLKWVMINLSISFVVLFAINIFEKDLHKRYK